MNLEKKLFLSSNAFNLNTRPMNKMEKVRSSVRSFFKGFIELYKRF